MSYANLNLALAPPGSDSLLPGGGLGGRLQDRRIQSTQSELDELLVQREMLNQRIQQIIDEHTDPWGVKVSTVEIKEVELPEQMRRSMAAQAEAERERRAKIIHADGEFQASERLAEAGAVISREPTTLQLRYLQTLTEIASERNSTIIFPLPINIFEAFTRLGSGAGSSGKTSGRS